MQDFRIPQPNATLPNLQGRPIYQVLAEQKDFQECVVDIVTRTGAPEEDMKKMFEEKDTYQEFAKCFVPFALDSVNNYELYEFVGDQSLNKATFNYIFRVLRSRIENKDKSIVIGYIDALKAHYVSKKFYSDLAVNIGFTEFLHRVCFQQEAAFDALKERKPKKLISLYEDVMEAFIGCLELTLDRFVGMHRGYAYVANFVYDLLSNVYIDFHPRSHWNHLRLLKETNDKIDSYNRNSPPGMRLRYYKIHQADKKSSRIIAISTTQKDREEGMQVVPGIWGNKVQDSTEGENRLAGQVLDYLRTIPAYSSVLATYPSPVALGVQDLITE